MNWTGHTGVRLRIVRTATHPDIGLSCRSTRHNLAASHINSDENIRRWVIN